MADDTATAAMPPQQFDDASNRYYTAAEMLEVALGAYNRGLSDAATNAGRTHWGDPDVVREFRDRRIATEMAAMQEKAEVHNIMRGLPEKYRYCGGPVDWDSSLPAGSACAWLRRQRSRRTYGLAGGGGR